MCVQLLVGVLHGVVSDVFKSGEGGGSCHTTKPFAPVNEAQTNQRIVVERRGLVGGQEIELRCVRCCCVPCPRGLLIA